MKHEQQIAHHSQDMFVDKCQWEHVSSILSMSVSRQSPTPSGPDICEALQLHKRFEPITDKELQNYFEGRRVAA